MRIGLRRREPPGPGRVSYEPWVYSRKRMRETRHQFRRRIVKAQYNPRHPPSELLAADVKYVRGPGAAHGQEPAIRTERHPAPPAVRANEGFRLVGAHTDPEP